MDVYANGIFVNLNGEKRIIFRRCLVIIMQDTTSDKMLSFAKMAAASLRHDLYDGGAGARIRWTD